MLKGEIEVPVDEQAIRPGIISTIIAGLSYNLFSRN
jgi:hypothetical protein